MVRNNRETGRRIPKEDHRPDQTDQNAALPPQPKPYGLTEGLNETDARTRKSEGVGSVGDDARQRKDAKGAYAKPLHGNHNDGVASADPRVLSGKPSGDATFDTEGDEDSGKK